MNNFQVSWINNEGLELYSGWTDYVSAINLFREICKEKAVNYILKNIPIIVRHKKTREVNP